MPFVDRYHAHIHHHGGEEILEEWNYSGLGDLEVVGFRSFDTGDQHFFASGRGQDADRRHERAERDRGPARTRGAAGHRIVGLPGGPRRSVAVPRLARGGRGDVRPPALESDGEAQRHRDRGLPDRVRGPSHLASEYPLSTRFAVLGQANFRIKGKDDVASSGVEEEDTGGSVLYLSPGARFSMTPRASIYALVQLPAYQRVNGIQVVSEANLYVGVSGGL
jgi:hypothetical protein